MSVRTCRLSGADSTHEISAIAARRLNANSCSALSDETKTTTSTPGMKSRSVSVALRFPEMVSVERSSSRLAEKDIDRSLKKRIVSPLYTAIPWRQPCVPVAGRARISAGVPLFRTVRNLHNAPASSTIAIAPKRNPKSFIEVQFNDPTHRRLTAESSTPPICTPNRHGISLSMDLARSWISLGRGSRRVVDLTGCTTSAQHILCTSLRG